MNVCSVIGLERRVTVLERRLHRWRMATTAAAILSLALLLVAAGTKGDTKEIRAKRFVVTDDAGKTRATLEVMPRVKLAGLALFAEDGRIVALFSASPEGSGGLNLMDKTGADRVVLTNDGEGRASLQVISKEQGKNIFWKAP